jgi:hypothetical protein
MYNFICSDNTDDIQITDGNSKSQKSPSTEKLINDGIDSDIKIIPKTDNKNDDNKTDDTNILKEYKWHILGGFGTVGAGTFLFVVHGTTPDENTESDQNKENEK